MKIGIDIDDVLACYMPVFLDRISNHYRIQIPIHALNGYSAKTEDYGYITCEQARSLLQKDKEDGILLDLPVHKGAVEAINQLASAHEIIIVTSRNNYEKGLLKKHTLEWLKKHGFKFHKLIFTNNKSATAKRLNLDIFIDDSLKFIQEVLKTGVKTILFAQPWNKKYRQFLDKQAMNVIIRDNNWLRLVSIINSYHNNYCKES